MAVSNVTDGIGIKIVCDRDDVVHQKNFSGPFLSPPNTNEIWVENLTNGDQASVRYALLLPLERDIGLLDVNYNGNTREWAVNLSTMELHDVQGSCQSLFIQRVQQALYSVCISPSGPDSSSLRVYEITLNTFALMESSVMFVDSYDSIEGDTLTNVVYGNRGRDGQYFYVISDSVSYFIDPSEHDKGFLLLQHAECANVSFTSLQYVSLDLLVHLSCCTENQTCSRYGVYYDTYGENDPLISAGLPYHCPNETIDVVVFVSMYQFIVNEMQYELDGDGFQDGLCSGSSTNPWFAYQDNTGQIFAVDLSPSATPTPRKVSENSCLQGPHCNPVRNVSDVLVIEEFVQDSPLILAKGIRPHENFSIIFELYSWQPNLYAFLDIPSKYTPTASPVTATQTPGITHSPSPTVKQVINNTNAIIVGAVVSSAAVIVMISVITIVAIILWRKQCNDTTVVVKDNNGDIALAQQEGPVGLPQAGPIDGGGGDIVVAVQPQGNGGQNVDVVAGLNELTDPTNIHKHTVYEKHNERRRTEDRQNDLQDKANYITNMGGVHGQAQTN